MLATTNAATTHVSNKETIMTSTKLKPGHILDVNKHTIDDSLKAKKRLRKLTQMLELDTYTRAECKEGICEIESVTISRRVIK